MIVKILDTEMEFNEYKHTGKDIVGAITKALSEKNLALDHLNIDGEEVRNRHAAYINEHIHSIGEIVVASADPVELAMENAVMVKESLESFLPIMDVMAEDFRLGVSERGWKEFENMIHTFLYLDKAIKGIFSMFIDAGNNRLTGAWDKVREEYIRLYKVLKDIEDNLNYDRPGDAGDLIQKKVKPIVAKTVERIGEMSEK